MDKPVRRAKATSSPPEPTPPPHKKVKQSIETDGCTDDEGCRFIGDPILESDARSTWPHRYKSSESETTIVLVTLSDGSTVEKELYQAKCHYSQAVVDKVVYNLNDDAFMQAEEGEPDFIGKIIEMFETVNNKSYICAQWFYRANDTVIKDQDHLIDKRRIFYSDVKDDNPLTCIISKAKIAKLPLNIEKSEREKTMKSSDLYVDMMYSFPHSFTNLCTVTDRKISACVDGVSERKVSRKSAEDFPQPRTLLDLYCGCGAMSSGLSIGALLAGENVVTRWAVDYNSFACKSLEFNHPNTEVRNVEADDYLILLVEWKKLCTEFNLVGSKAINFEAVETDDMDDADNKISDDLEEGEYEVEKVIDIWYGVPQKCEKRGLYFKVCWKGYGPDYDSWEPADSLSNCKEKIKEFVAKGYNARILPLPGDVDFICGGPPCQGISGFNRHRDPSGPLKDEKNRQLTVYMDIIQFLKPRYVLMENVTDILKFAKGLLASHAVGRLVSMDYQARLGIMAAGAYGVPQCRMRFFLWGAGPMESLPQFPLPTHEVMKKGVVTNEFKDIIVGHDSENGKLHKSVLLEEALSDLPEVTNYTDQDEMPFESLDPTSFQRFIRLRRRDIFGESHAKENDDESKLFDHRPLKLNEDDFERVELIPKEKGANFRDLPGLVVGPDNVVRLNPAVERPLCASGKFLVPEYALSFEGGKSSKPFGRLFGDEIVGTVVGRAEPHNQSILHWNQNRVLTIRENARLQGFPDCYRLFGPVKQRYIQVGNAVSFSVSIPLGYCLAKAMKGDSVDTPVTLPFEFPGCLELVKSARGKLEESNE